ncbi:hypothetical protein [Altibacter sp. HG106]|uniref:hypothetical protein n=1 Tax=Altibacter sp. HG106 TaxID=3023937 RepID=UPI0023502D96|nr:hypothetical protein [Altibacter sp. HG106]MDC7996324.1 hypothetical protein [Altibacter sp. HG106]
MASIRNLKKDINFVIGEIIEAVYVWELTHPKKDTKESEKIIDDALSLYDRLIASIHQKEVESPKQHFNGIREELEKEGRALIDRINTLS